jgi:4-hydroxyacetophenone monooxygenase
VLDAEMLRRALDDANIPTLLLVVYQLTGDEKWLREPYVPRRGATLDDNDSGQLAEDTQYEVREAAFEAIAAREAGAESPVELTPERITELLGYSLIDTVPVEYGELLAEEFGLNDRGAAPVEPVPSGSDVLIIGAGMAGLGMAVKLKAAGIPFQVVEKDPDAGGVWLQNTYPGCGVDTPSHLYSFSFAPNAQWSRFFAKRDEIWGYLSDIADRYDLRSSISFGTEVVSATYDEAAGMWDTVVRKDGVEQTLTTRVLISAVGQVSIPSLPSIPGLDEFEGAVMHTARWDSSVDLTGKRVAVTGTGASAMQVVPTIAESTDELVIFQRSKQWVMPHPNYHRDVPEGVRYLMGRVPEYGAWYRLRAFWNFGDKLHPALQIDPEWQHPERSVNAVSERHRIFLTKYIERQLGDRKDLRDLCVPEYPPYGKRPLQDNHWFDTVKRDNVKLVGSAVDHVRSGSVVGRDGEEHDVDVLVLATGFKTLQFLATIDVRGKDGRSLHEQWGPDDARAYLGVTVAGFPNLYILNGPNTLAGHGGSAFVAVEMQIGYVMQCLSYMIDHHLASLEVTEDSYWAYNNDLDAALNRSIWSHKGMTTYYRNDAGRVVVASPWTYLEYWRRIHAFAPEDYAARELEPSPVS